MDLMITGPRKLLKFKTEKKFINKKRDSPKLKKTTGYFWKKL